MRFQKGKSGNPNGRPKGAVSHSLALKHLLEEVFQENQQKAKQMLLEMFESARDFRRLCELKALFEVKEMPSKVQGEGMAPVIQICWKDENEKDLPILRN